MLLLYIVSMKYSRLHKVSNVKQSFELSPAKVMALILFVGLFFIAPVILIESSKAPSGGKVAGINTSIEKGYFPQITLEIDLNNQPGLFFIAGIIFIGIGSIVIIFLLIDNRRFKSKRSSKHN